MQQTSERQLDEGDSRSHRKSPSSGRHHRHHHRQSRHARSRSPRRDDDKHKRRRSRSPPPAPRPVTLPYHAKELSKRNFEEYKPLFQSYLDIQKQIILDELDEREVKGRWKSFVGKWNRGELSRSWYDPSMLKQAQETVHSLQATEGKRRASPAYSPRAPEPQSDDDDFGPAPPPGGVSRRRGHGPTVPGFDDLALRNELQGEDRARDQASYVDGIRYERKMDRNVQKERLDELVPRADPGSRERQLEKKRETTGTLKEFGNAKESGDVEVGDADLMGDDGVEVYKKRKRDAERQKSEREIRKEEIARARDAEREERLTDLRAKEAKTMDFLKTIAKERFG